MTKYLDIPGFCVAPFVHSCIWTDGRVIPCCINQDEVFGDAKAQNLNDIYSNENQSLTEFRRKLINGETPKSCYRCTNPEKELGTESFRMFLNKKYGKLTEQVIIGPDGKVDQFNIAYYDVRFSNLCTLKCRMCDHINSSAIASEENKNLGTKHKIIREPFEDFDEFSEFFIKNIEYVEDMYFCGGEPLILDYHYKLLQLLIDHEKTDVALKYNSNCATISYRDKKITDYWKKFPKVCLGMSLDDIGQRAEYIRDGSNWEDIIQNLKLIRKECPHVTLEWMPTVQAMNMKTLPELHAFLLSENLIDNWHFNQLTEPEFYSTEILPKRMKENIALIWENHIRFLSRIVARKSLLKQAEEVILFMTKKDKSNLIPKFKEETLKKDMIRNQSFVQIFPDLKELME